MQTIEWSTPSEDAAGSMPLGNGDIGLNVWIDPAGALRFYIGKTDAWGESGQLYKVGRVRVELRARDGRPLLLGQPWSWSLDLHTATMRVCSPHAAVVLRVDANHPFAFLTAEGPAGMVLEAAAEVWRTERRPLTGQEQHSLLTGGPEPVHSEPDETILIDERTVAVLHHNRSSVWRANLARQRLAEWEGEAADPLLGNTFGYAMRGEPLRRSDEALLAGASPDGKASLTVAVLTCRDTAPAGWRRCMSQLLDGAPAPRDAQAEGVHRKWWEQFWARSFVEMRGDETAATVSLNYAAQRFLNACAGRGAYPIKFNGSIFTVDWGYPRTANRLQPDYPAERFDADYRRWGPGYWHQNTRLPYWAMLGAGDYDLMDPFFAMYRDALPLAEFRTRKLCGHSGVFFPEAMTFWGTYLDHHYGWPGQRDPMLPRHLAMNGYMRRHHSSGLEVAHLALLRHARTNDEEFLQTTALPIADAVLAFYDGHFQRRQGKLHIAPAQVLEQWWEASDPLPDLAGLQAVTRLILQLGTTAPTKVLETARRLSSELPPLPMRSTESGKIFDPAARWDGPPRNRENPELYALFPFLLCPPGSPLFTTADETFSQRTYRDDIGWMQDGIQAALLGRVPEAVASIVNRLGAAPEAARFPAFWGPNWDWIPDQDHGNTAAIALQFLCQWVEGPLPDGRTLSHSLPGNTRPENAESA